MGYTQERAAKEWRWAVWLISGSIAMFVLLNIISAMFQVRDEGSCRPVSFDQEMQIGVGDRVCIIVPAIKPVSAVATPAAPTVAGSAVATAPATAPAPTVATPTATAASSDSNTWHLKIDGTIVATSREYRKTPADPPFLNFKLNKDDDAESESAVSLRRIWGGQAPDLISGLIEKQVLIEKVGTAGGKSSPFTLPKAKLRVFFPLLIVVGSLILLLFVAGTVFACRSSGIIRDPANGTYSLARTQMMFWFVLVTICFVFIYMSTGQMRGVLTTSTLALVGIYSVTSLFAASPVPAGGAVTPVQGSFFGQLLSGSASGDPKDFTGERLITVIWSIILGSILLNAVLSKFAFPEFDASSLTLAGLSSGSFAGFKKLGK